MAIGNPIFRGCASSKLAGSCAKLDVQDWLKDVVNTVNTEDLVEIRFKNTRKDYYANVNQLNLEVGDLVAVEGNPGHDIGMVSLTGDLVLKQMKRHKVTLFNGEMKKIYRLAKPVDVEKWELAMKREHETMIKTRQIATDLRLNMKIGDVEYQGDGTKAIFYYIADERVDFRQLIRVLAETFRIRIEMKQIGARQEAGRIGGIGPCGRELCCSSWMSGFSSVTTVAARFQEISMNPQKLAGQCSKLKCCLNYEIDSYFDEQKDFPAKERLSTEEGDYNYIKTDVFKRTYWYTLSSKAPTGQIGVPVERVRFIQRMNRKGQKPEKLLEPILYDENNVKEVVHEYGNVVGQDSLTRFDKPKDGDRKRHMVKRRPKPSGQHREQDNAQRTSQNNQQREINPNRNNRENNPNREHNPAPENNPNRDNNSNRENPNQGRRNRHNPGNRRSTNRPNFNPTKE